MVALVDGSVILVLFNPPVYSKVLFVELYGVFCGPYKDGVANAGTEAFNPPAFEEVPFV